MKYEIITKSWSKRRKIDDEEVIKDIQLIDFKKEHNHFCKMLVIYQNKTEKILLARVIYNEIKQHWSVDGMSVAIRLLEF
ncbi:hypothetical protein [Aliikangiella sp. IMCC44359]|uniref:hypothetical protein n=1 Tax=Aliikangiella sp. IMCC44359 TaxID=3459125 RepID=UPI00403A932D